MAFSPSGAEQIGFGGTAREERRIDRNINTIIMTMLSGRLLLESIYYIYLCFLEPIPLL